MTGCGCGEAKCRLAAGDARHGTANGYINRGCRCVACTTAKREYAARYRAENAEKVRERKARYRVENAEKVREYAARYRAENAEKAREYAARYRAENAEKVRERHARYHAENREKKHEYAARYRAENREKKHEYAARYRAENREKIRECNARYRASPEGRAVGRAKNGRRRARKRNKSCSCCATSAGYAAVWVLDSGRCAYCNDPATDIEHVIPLSTTGWDCVWNLRAACGRCNYVKGPRPLSYLLARLEAAGIPIRPGATNSGLPCPAAAARMAVRMLPASPGSSD